ncbi:uncharacterized protein JN550_011106 [Neoarthrinium moseri]|uniref:uncharacterized protein n=1 Tax=Neoarthrinium moseri TaxID=1658444 RepID=UPI001FDDA981|nr:uncharacterized protein JN550_011106 [Neoarthrinium moseri]KAI1860951.1 hypothetical protein JN550_011106 [Neoarthrinium moseri]
MKPVAVVSFLVTLIAVTFAKDSRTFAVLRFNNEPGKFSTEGRMDPIVSPGAPAGHSHGVMGGHNFGLTVQGDQLLESNCTNAMIKNDKSNYWVPDLWFQSPRNSTFKKVPLFYMQVYYFFDATNDVIKPFPPGLKMVIGDSSKRTPPATGAIQLDPSRGAIQPVQWVCPANGDPNRYPVDSDGTRAGLQDPTDRGAGAGFPVINCDIAGAPLRQDIHFPSCYNPAAGIDDHKNNMVFPTPNGNKFDCPKGWTHLPHLFYEVYYDTTPFANEWTRDGQTQPYVLSNGDRTGYSSHGDMISGWDTTTLQAIIDGCDAGNDGMDKCPRLIGGINTSDRCKIDSAVPNPRDEWLTALPGNNPLSGWGVGGV